jgi:hypothetical protein
VHMHSEGTHYIGVCDSLLAIYILLGDLIIFFLISYALCSYIVLIIYWLVKAVCKWLILVIYLYSHVPIFFGLAFLFYYRMFR